MLRAPMIRPSMRCLALLIPVLVACAPEIGDGCETSVDCSVNGERICDRTQPGGYCTIQGCEPDTCPDGASCVEFRGMPDRTSVTFCMDGCGNDGDCRTDYVCVNDMDARLLEGYPDDLDSMSLARVIDLNEGRADDSFCVTDPDM